ncbi:uncharacterized protein [Asterias amurensis]|uniref:uncharacterized protein n=1 Tax=Asterias amurensis TaxID=7602 RepID=UPI003AB4FE88
MDSLRICLLMFSYFLLVSAVVGDCEEKQEFSGCNADGKQCVCGTKMACRNPFAFRDQKRCQRALYPDPCKKNHCRNKGYCLQTKSGVFACECAGTGFYGQRCTTKCPKDLSTIPLEDRASARACIY